MRAEDFFRHVVTPTVADYLAEPTNLRRAQLAAVVLHQLTDYWAVENLPCTTDKELRAAPEKARELMSAKCPEFAWVWDVADAVKHARLAASKKKRLVASSADLKKPPGIFNAPWGHGYFGEACIVYVESKDDGSRALPDLIRSVVQMWEAEFPPGAGAPP